MLRYYIMFLFRIWFAFAALLLIAGFSVAYFLLTQWGGTEGSTLGFLEAVPLSILAGLLVPGVIGSFFGDHFAAFFIAGWYAIGVLLFLAWVIASKLEN